MLQAIRSKATSFVVKLLFGLLIVTFGIWGIADIFQQGGAADTTVAKVGDRTITIDQVSQEAQSQLDQLKSAFGGSVDAGEAKELGVVDNALQNLIRNNLFSLEINRLGLAIGDQAVRDAILGTTSFHDATGKFDRNLYTQVLAANHLTNAQFEEMERGVILDQQLTDALTDGLPVPQTLIDTLYRSRAEQRSVSLVTVPLAAAGIPPVPTESEIEAYYKAHPDQFRAPERRSFKVALLRLDDVAADIKLSDDELTHAFEARRDEFRTPEQRHLQQMLLPDEATAKTAAGELAGGKDFAAVAKDVAKVDNPATLDLGFVAEQDLPPELAKPAFALSDGGNTAPIQTSFGWQILHQVATKPASEQTFDQAKDKLRQEVARDQAADRLADIANNVDDAMAGGGTFDNVAQKFGMKVMTANEIDAKGNGADGKRDFDVPKHTDHILQTAFSTESGQTSTLTELGEDGYYIVQVQKIIPAATRPLAEVHDDVMKQAQLDTLAKDTQKIADDIAAQLNSGKSFKDVAATRQLPLTTAKVGRNDDTTKTPAGLVEKLFDAKQGAVVTEPIGGGVMVAQLDAIEPGDPAKDELAVKQLKEQLVGVMQADLLSEYDQALRHTFPIEVVQSNLDRVL